MKRTVALLYPFGAFCIVFATGLVHARYTSIPYSFGSQNSVLAYACFALLHLSAATVAGIPDEADDVQPAVLRAALGAISATAAWVLLQTVFPGLLPRRVILQNGPLQAVWSFVCALAVLRSEQRSILRDRVCALVPSEDVAALEADCSRQFPYPEQSFELSAVVTVDELTSCPTAAEVHALLAAGEPTVIAVAEAATTLPRVVDAITLLHRSGIKVRTMAQFYEEYIGKESLAELTRMTMLFDVRSMHHPTYRRSKRVLDVAGGLVALVAAAVAVPVVVLGNVVANRGPLFYSQLRVGLNGRPFRIVKFRTMRTAPGATDTLTWTSPDDPRVTAFGRLLRRSHLDELPQGWNILRGELSLVGPRPEQPHYVEELLRKEPAYELRLLVPPGLTGWAQIKHRYAATEAETIEKLQYDLYYLRNQSLSLDLRILSRTVRSVLRRRGR